MAQKTRAGLVQESETTFPTNNAKQIIASNHRTFNLNQTDSVFNLLDDTAEDIPFSDPSFTATNTKAAILEVGSGSKRPLFYARLSITEDGFNWAATLSDTNYAGLTVVASGLFGNNAIVAFSFPDTNSAFGSLIRREFGMNSITATSAELTLSPRADIIYTVIFYPEYVATDYVVND